MEVPDPRRRTATTSFPGPRPNRQTPTRPQPAPPTRRVCPDVSCAPPCQSTCVIVCTPRGIPGPLTLLPPFGGRRGEAADDFQRCPSDRGRRVDPEQALKMLRSGPIIACTCPANSVRDV